MKGKSHLTCGLIAGIGCAAISLKFKNISPTQFVSIAACSSAASLLPDIDMPNSKLGKKFGFISKIINKLFGHRTITHTFLWIIPLIILLYKYSETEYSYILAGTLVGFVTHIFSDTMTRGGVPWFWPFKRKRYHLTNVNSGERDYIFVIITDILILGAYYFANVLVGI